MEEDYYSRLAGRFLSDSSQCEIKYVPPLVMFFNKEEASRGRTHVYCEVYSKVEGNYKVILELLVNNRKELFEDLEKGPQRVEREGNLFFFVLSDNSSIKERREIVKKLKI